MAALVPKRTAVLLGISLVLGALLVWDTRTGGVGKAGGELQADGGLEDKTAMLRRKLRESKSLRHSRAAIESGYQQLAPGYVENAARLLTLHTQGNDPKKVAEETIRDIAAGVDITRLLVGEVRQVGDGVRRISASLQIDSTDSAAFMKTLWVLGNPSYGMVWDELNIIADPQEARLSLVGKLDLLVVEAAE